MHKRKTKQNSKALGLFQGLFCTICQFWVFTFANIGCIIIQGYKNVLFQYISTQGGITMSQQTILQPGKL
ncbi:MAG: hypothetical protein IKA29_00400, partial [Clostridia bacterium]|nr:hypothetical protein [Clostridia bacterium]